MNFKAKQVLLDCKLALLELQEAENNNDIQKIRIRWYTCLALLRSVGHVLENVDKVKYNIYSKLFEEQHNSKKTDKIFSDFIRNERNLILKEYEYYIQKETNTINEQDCIIFDDGSYLLLENGDRLGTEQTRLVIKYFIKSNGFDESKFLSEIVSKAINWWEIYFYELENKIKIKNNGNEA